MRNLHHPEVKKISLSAVMHALSDPVRLQIVRTLGKHGERHCGGCGLELPKATQSHHFKVLREAGIVSVRAEGTQRCLSLRREELDKRFPGLLDAVLKAKEPL
jgi:DNA-binding transcriptional ArsR family regulator